MCPQQLDHKPHNHPTPTSTSQSEQRAVTGDHKKDARIHCAILNKHTTTTTTTATHSPKPNTGTAIRTGSNRHRKPNPTTIPPKKIPEGRVCVCFFRTQQGVHRHHQPHPADRSLPTRSPGTGPTRPTKPLSVVTRQCLRHRAPPPHIRGRRAPHPFSREGAP
jgi:hypothetical protein